MGNIRNIPGAAKPPVSKRWLVAWDITDAVAAADAFAVVTRSGARDRAQRRTLPMVEPRGGSVTTRCVTKGCGRFVYASALWCRECEPRQPCKETYPPDCVPERVNGSFGVCCMVEAAAERLGIDPYSNVDWREQYDALPTTPSSDG